MGTLVVVVQAVDAYLESLSIGVRPAVRLLALPSQLARQWSVDNAAAALKDWLYKTVSSATVLLLYICTWL